MQFSVRVEPPGDEAPIRAVHLGAFPTPAEANLVDVLRRTGDTVISLVAEGADGVIGHTALSVMQRPARCLGLAPVAVLPGCQGLGAGSRLITEGLALARVGGWRGVFVLGAPAYYTRFGFSVATAAKFDTPYSREHFMALELINGAFASDGSAAIYAAAFA